MNAGIYITLLILIMTAACGVERGVPVDTLPLQPSDETLNKKKLAIDPAGYSTGEFTLAGSYGIETVTVDIEGSFYIFSNTLYEADSGLELRPRALKFLADGTIDTSYNPVERFEDSIEDFNMDTSSAFVNGAKELFLLADKQTGRDLQRTTAGTSIIKFNSAGYVDTAFAVKGSINSAEHGYTDIKATEQFLFIGGDSIRRFSLAGVIDKTFAGSGKLANVSGEIFVTPDNSIFLDYGRRFDALGVEDDRYDILTTVIGWDAAQNGVLLFKGGNGATPPSLSLVNSDGALNTAFGVNGFIELTWLTGTIYSSQLLSGNRILGYRVTDELGLAQIDYVVFNSDGSRNSAFGDPETGKCSYRLEAISKVALLPTGKVMITGESGTDSVIKHLGDTCVPVPVEP